MDVTKLLQRQKNYLYKSKILTIILSSSGTKALSGKNLNSQLMRLIKQNLNLGQEEYFSKEIQKVKNYLLSSYESQGNKSIVFVVGAEIFEVFHFEFSLAPQLIAASKPHLDKLQEALTEHSRYMVLCADREKAKLFTVYLGRIEKQEEFFSLEVPQNVKTQKILAGRDNKYFRHIEQHLHKYLQQVAEHAQKFAQGKKISFLLIGGHKELLGKIRRHLTYPLDKIVIGEFITPLNIPLQEIFERSKDEARKINKLLPPSFS